MLRVSRQIQRLQPVFNAGQIRTKRRIVYSDKSKNARQRLLKVSYDPRKEPTPVKHLIEQQREEEERGKLQELIDEFSVYTESKFESTLLERLIQLRDSGTAQTDDIHGATALLQHRNLQHITQIVEWLKSHDINISNEESLLYIQATLHVSFTQKPHLANNDRFQPLGRSLLVNNARTVVAKAIYNENKLSKREVSLLELSMLSTQTLAKLCDDIKLSPLVMCEKVALDIAKASTIRAIVATIYLQQGPEKCRKFVDKCIMPVLLKYLEQDVRVPQDKISQDIIPLPPKFVTVDGVPDYVTLLEDYIRDQFKATVQYRTLKGDMQAARRLRLRRFKMTKKERRKNKAIESPNPSLWVGVFINGELMGNARGDSYTHAKHSAAKQVYDELRFAPYRREQLKNKLTNMSYVHSVSKIMGIE